MAFAGRDGPRSTNEQRRKSQWYIRGDQHRPRFQPSESTASTKAPKQADAAKQTAKSGKTASSAKTAAPDRAVTAKGSQAAQESKALANAKEKLVSGDSAAKFASQLKDFGTFANKLTKGFGDVGQFLNTINGALDKTLKGLQDGMQFAEKLGGFENQLKGSLRCTHEPREDRPPAPQSFKGLQGGAPPPAGQPGTPAPATGGTELPPLLHQPVPGRRGSTRCTARRNACRRAGDRGGASCRSTSRSACRSRSRSGQDASVPGRTQPTRTRARRNRVLAATTPRQMFALQAARRPR